MRRIDIFKSVIHLLEIIRTTKVIEKNGLLHSSPKEVEKIEALEAIRNFTIEYEKLSSTEKEVAKIFKLDLVTKSQNWLLIMNHEKSTNIPLYEMTAGFYQFVDFVPKVLALFEQEYVNLFLEEKSERPENFKDKAILTVILPEHEDHFSNPIRLSQILESITLIYQTCAFLIDASPDELSVLAIDSGSDKSFDFLGNAEVIKCVKEFIFELWDRVVFFRGKKIDQKLDLVIKTLPILEQINESEKNGKIGPEQAEILRRNIEVGTDKFIKVGAITADLEKNSSYDPRQIMAPERKMLTEHKQVEEKNVNGKQDETEKLTPEEKETFYRLMKKMSDNKDDTV